MCDKMRTIAQVLGQIICKNLDKHDFEKTNRCTKPECLLFLVSRRAMILNKSGTGDRAPYLYIIFLPFYSKLLHRK